MIATTSFMVGPWVSSCFLGFCPSESRQATADWPQSEFGSFLGKWNKKLAGLYGKIRSDLPRRPCTAARLIRHNASLADRPDPLRDGVGVFSRGAREKGRP